MAGTIRDIADYLETEAGRATGRGEHESAVAMLTAALNLRALPLGVPAAKRLLREGKHFPKMGEMDPEHRAAISEGRSKRNPMMKAAHKAGFGTLGDLCGALEKKGYKLKPSFLSKVGTGAKPMPETLGRLLRDLIGWEP